MHRPTHRITARVLLLSLVIALHATAAHAQTADPNALIERGLAALEHGRDQQAMDEFTRAWDLGRIPRARAMMAQAALALGRWVEAETYLNEALAATSDPWIQSRATDLASVRQEIESHLGSVEITSDVPGAEVWIGVNRVGITPLPHAIRAPAGSVTFEVRVTGRDPIRRTVALTAGGLVRETVTFAAGSGAVEPTRGAAPVSRVATPLVPSTSAPVPVLPIVGFVLTAAGVGVGLGGYFMQQQAADAYNARSQCVGVDLVDSDATCLAARGSVGTGQVLEGVGFAAAGVFGVVSIVLLATGGSRGHRESGRGAVQWGCGPQSGAPGVHCMGTF